ncbi:Butyrophilin subfamily 2 member A1 [Varanus komodoensis]|nr:Butyrophilin subfamily 2 member A1 [Varanus komodoensis]
MRRGGGHKKNNLTVLKKEIPGKWVKKIVCFIPQRPEWEEQENESFCVFLTSAQDMEIKWFRPQKSSYVHLYHGGRDHLERQLPEYQGRTEFLKDGIGEGKIELKILNVSFLDEGQYHCSVKQGSFHQEATLDMRLAVSGTAPLIAIEGYQGRGIRVVCRSSGWYPKPEILWIDPSGRLLPAPAKAASQKNSGLFDVQNEIIVTGHSDQKLTCVVRNLLLNQNQSSTIHITDHFFQKVSPWIIGLSVSLIIAVLSLIVSVLYLLNGNSEYVGCCASRLLTAVLCMSRKVLGKRGCLEGKNLFPWFEDLEAQLKKSSGAYQELFRVVQGLVRPGPKEDLIPPSKAHCDDFARHFREKIAQLRRELDSTIESEVLRETPMLPSGPELLDEFQLLRPDDVDKVLGQDSKHGIGTWILEVVNVSLREGRVPAPLKEVVVRLVLKKASLDPEMATNYRPVANIPFLGKVLERVVAGQLQALLDETDYLDPFQSGFRPGYGEAVAVLNRCLVEVMGWMRANKLKLNPDKTEVLLVGGSGFGEGELNLVLNGVALPPRDKVRSLGVLLDPELSLEAQVTAAARSAFLQLRLIHQLRPYLEYDCLATVTHALVTSCLDLCNTLYVGLPLKMVRILQLVQNRAARLLTGTGCYVDMTPVFRQLHWLPIEVRAQFKQRPFYLSSILNVNIIEFYLARAAYFVLLKAQKRTELEELGDANRKRCNTTPPSKCGKAALLLLGPLLPILLRGALDFYPKPLL